ncbi:MAG: DegT/DnrJ/EryC1/StrS family aminotransferase [Lachnospiraceae bacterium]|nr:DegT/DnrJ/EryC1/StrS family aminotransferase [Lachnospiraceae bacterium]
MEFIQPNRLDRGFYKYQNEFEDKALEVLRSGWYVLGKEVSSFEEEFAAWVGSRYCVGVGNGLDALWMAFRVLGIGPGDEVLVQGNTYIASVMGITINGATPIFVEPDEYYQIDTKKLEALITPRTKAILVVHLYGHNAKMDDVVNLCHKYNLHLVEDCAQSHGSAFKGRKSGTFGDIGCFSFYPSKNLGAFGDGGAITTDDEQIAQDMKVLRNYGSEKRYYNKIVGANSRLDEIQAGLLRVKLRHLDELCEERRELADYYSSHIQNEKLILPQEREDTHSIWHQYVVRCHERDALISYLNERLIGTIIHYPIPPHLSEAYQYLGYGPGSFPITEQCANEVLSIPMYNGMTREEQKRVVDALNAF